VLVRFDHLASFIVNANPGIMSYGRGAGVGRDLGDGASLGVGVGLGVDVGVGVDVDVAVGVGVGVGVGVAGEVFTVIVTGSEGIPFATTSRELLPASAAAGTSKFVETFS
jgi:hypothetical protein